jgi:Flp pilus assembly pilin Flp
MTFLFSNSDDKGQSFLEYALIIVLIAIVVLAILLIMGDDIRVFVIELWDKASYVPPFTECGGAKPTDSAGARSPRSALSPALCGLWSFRLPVLCILSGSS